MAGTLTGPGDVAALVRKIRGGAGPLGFDTETSGLRWATDRIVGVSIATSPRDATYVPIRHVDREGNALAQNVPMEAFRDILGAVRESGRLVVGHNLAFDLAMLAHEEGGEIPNPIFDTMISQWMLAHGVRPAGGYGLDACGKRTLGIGKFAKFEDLAEDAGFQFVPLEKAADYAAQDAVVPLRLHRHDDPLLDEFHYREVFERLEMEIVRVIAHMNCSGVRIDLPYLQEEVHPKLLREMEEYRTRLNALLGRDVPITSPIALSKLMYEELKLWNPRGVKVGKNGLYSTDEDSVLHQVRAGKPTGRKAAELLLCWRRRETIRKMFTAKVPGLVQADGYLRPYWDQTGTESSRLASSNPSGQNIRRDPRPGDDESPLAWERGFPSLRKAFVAGPGRKLIDTDFSQVEARAAAHFTQDPMLLKVYRDGLDIHRQTAEAVGCDRQTAKVVNFQLIYGGSAFALAMLMKIPQEEADRYHAKFFRTYTAIQPWIQKVIRFGRKHGYVQTLAGRRRLLPDLNSPNPKRRRHAENAAGNTVIQGTCADIMKIAMRDLWRRWVQKGWIRFSGLPIRARFCMTIHDELLCEVNLEIVEEAERDMRECFEGAASLTVPLVAEPGVGDTWSEAHA